MTARRVVLIAATLTALALGLAVAGFAVVLGAPDGDGPGEVCCG